MRRGFGEEVGFDEVKGGEERREGLRAVDVEVLQAVVNDCA